MIILKRDITDPEGKEFARFDHWTQVGKDVVATNADGTYLYQEPGVYGLFNVTPNLNGPYQYGRPQGQLVSYHTRKEDPPFVYSWVELPN